MSAVQPVSTPSVAALAERARRIAWDKDVEDVPFEARYAFKEAITADLFLEMLEALRGVVKVADRATVEFDKARAVIAKVSAGPRFAETFCSQCGKNLGPGDAGVAHCDEHRRAA